MQRSMWRAASVARAATLAALLGLAGCGGSGAPAVSGSSTEVTVSGTVTYKGKPVTEGEIVFDPANINRRDAPMATAPIGADGAYTIKTLEGENTVSFRTPAISKKDFTAASASYVYEAPAGESTKDFEIGASNP